jgi:LPXTG-site transpeptidase (sortase) family protein
MADLKILHFLKTRFLNPQGIMIVILAACIVAGGSLIYQEWEARRPMDFSLPQPVFTTSVASETDVNEWLYPAITPPKAPPRTPPPASAVTSGASTGLPPRTPSAPTTEQTGVGKSLSLKPDEIGQLTIEGKKISIKRGIAETTLKKNVGWMETSAAPGQPGVCVLMGHRDQDLKQLKKIKVGGVITVETPDGSFAYTVYAMDILDKDTAAQIPAAEGAELMLVTCYPFYFSGSAPQ